MMNKELSDPVEPEYECTHTNKRVWKPVPDFEGLYTVSDHGEVMGLKSGKILKTTTGASGKKSVTLFKASRIFRRTVHRIVLQAFRGDVCKPKFLNGDPGDPRLENLRNRPGYKRMTAEKAVFLRKKEKEGMGWKEMSEEYGISPEAVRRCLARETWKYFEPDVKPPVPKAKTVREPYRTMNEREKWELERERERGEND